MYLQKVKSKQKLKKLTYFLLASCQPPTDEKSRIRIRKLVVWIHKHVTDRHHC
jgi:hypothetical protein